LVLVGCVLTFVLVQNSLCHICVQIALVIDVFLHFFAALVTLRCTAYTIVSFSVDYPIVGLLYHTAESGVLVWHVWAALELFERK
jgi:hypothetical protein